MLLLSSTVKRKALVASPFYHNFCLGKTKIPPKLRLFSIFNPELKHGAIDSQEFKSVE